MRILFVLKLPLVRHFDETLAALADRGHQILIAPTKFGDEELLPERLSVHPNCRVVSGAAKRTRAAVAASVVRATRDYLRYQEPALIGAEVNRRRAFASLVRTVSRGTRTLPAELPDLAVALNTQEVWRLRETFDELEQLFPLDPEFDQFFATQRPDLLLVTPLVSFGGLQADYVKAARRLGVPSACLVFSWDNLSNKGIMHERPDRTYVWNEVQRREAVELHQVPADSVVVTGAPRFDPFFGRTVSTTREAFCESLGRDPTRRLVAYLGSSPLVAEREPELVVTWLDALRGSSSGALREAQIAIRRHPRSRSIWSEHPVFRKKQPAAAGYPGVAMTPAKSAMGDQALYDLLSHADAVVGLNTTAELEAGILGTPVYTIRATEFASGQTGSHHFQYLLKENGGFVECAADLNEHMAQLAAGLSGRFDRGAIRTFIRDFVRPHGLEQPVAPILADDIEAWANTVAGSGQASGGLPSEPGQLEGAADAPTAPPGVPEPEKVQVVYAKAPLFILVETHAERMWRLDPGRKEPWTVEWFDTQVRRGDVVYDIGANVGVFSLIAAANLDGRGTVLAFEPGYATYARLCENIRLNKLNSLIVPIPVPLSDRPGLQRFRYKSLEPGQSRHKFAAESWDPATTSVKASDQAMLATSLDQVVSQYAAPMPNLIKLDVDGAEALVLRGAGEALRYRELRSVLAEVDPACEDEVLQVLSTAGFNLIDRFKRKKKAGSWYGIFRR